MKNSRRARQSGRAIPQEDAPVFDQTVRTPRKKRVAELEAKTPAQAEYLRAIASRQIVFGVGPAGTGKTYIAARHAASLMENRMIERILLTRPAVEVGAKIGYLPGEVDEKMAPYMASFGPGFEDGLGSGHFKYLMEAGRIAVCPLNFMQGMTFRQGEIVLFDEAENAMPVEMKMFLTRIGEGSQVIITGDPTQKMIPGPCGLTDAVSRVGRLGEVGVVRFGREDIVRSGVVRKILDAYDDSGINEVESVMTDQPSLPGFITHGASR